MAHVSTTFHSCRGAALAKRCVSSCPKGSRTREAPHGVIGTGAGGQVPLVGWLVGYQALQKTLGGKKMVLFRSGMRWLVYIEIHMYIFIYTELTKWGNTLDECTR